MGYGQMGGIGALWFYDQALPENMRENKMMSFMGIWLGGQMVSSALTKTNAFEIYLGKNLVWSTLKNERMPNMRDLLDGFSRAGVTIAVPQK